MLQQQLLPFIVFIARILPTSMHFHKGAIGVSGGVESAIAGPYTTGMKGVATLTATQEVDLFTNLWYFNLHSATFTGGEIRGQLVR
jgi:hypothetical protein